MACACCPCETPGCLFRSPRGVTITPSGFTDGSQPCSIWNNSWQLRQPVRSECIGSANQMLHCYRYCGLTHSIYFTYDWGPQQLPTAWFRFFDCSSGAIVASVRYRSSLGPGYSWYRCDQPLVLDLQDYIGLPFCGSVPPSVTVVPPGGMADCGCCDTINLPLTLRLTITQSTCANFPVNTIIPLIYTQVITQVGSLSIQLFMPGWVGTYTGVDGTVYYIIFDCTGGTGPGWGFVLYSGDFGNEFRASSSGAIPTCRPFSYGPDRVSFDGNMPGCNFGDFMFGTITL
jgi:hypothetical protein